MQFRTAWLKGDEVTAMKILNRTKLDDKVKAEMLRDIEVFKTIKGQTGYTSSSQVTDVITSQFLQTTDNAFRGKELNRKKNLSSDRASVHFTAKVLERVKQGESFSEALKAEDALLYKGINDKKGEYAVKTVNKVQTFLNFADADSLNASSLEEFFRASEKTEEAWNEIKELDVITINSDQLATLSTTVNGKINLRSLLNDPEYAVRLIPPDTLNTIKDILIDKAVEQQSGLTRISNQDLQKNTNHKQISSLIPQIVKDIAKASGLSDVQAMNMILRSNFGSVIEKDGEKVKPWPVLTIGANSQDVSIMMNEGNYVAPKNEDGYNFFNSMKANTGFVPMRPETSMCTWEDRSVIEAFVEENGDVISWNTLDNDYDTITPTDFTFTQTTKEGAKWDTDKGGFVIHDVKAFAEAGGINQLINAGYSEDVLKLFGIPTFTNTIKGK